MIMRVFENSLTFPPTTLLNTLFPYVFSIPSHILVIKLSNLYIYLQHVALLLFFAITQWQETIAANYNQICGGKKWLVGESL